MTGNRKFMVLLLSVLLVGAFAVAAQADYATAVMADNPLAYYRFDSDTAANATTTLDQTGSNNGTYVGTGASVVAGPSIAGMTGNQALSLTGSQYAALTTMPGFGPAIPNGVTIEMWIKDSATTRQGMIGSTGGSNSMFFHTDRSPVGTMPDSDDRIRAVYTGGLRIGGSDNDTNVTDGSWNYLAITVASNATDVADRLHIYMANQGETTVTELTGLTIPDLSNPLSELTYAMFLGAINNNNTSALNMINGQIDEVAIYNTGLTASQLNNHLQGIPEPGTITLLVIGMIGLLAYAWRKRR